MCLGVYATIPVAAPKNAAGGAIEFHTFSHLAAASPEAAQTDSPRALLQASLDICLLPEWSVDEIVAKLSSAELEQVIKIVGRSPRGYPPGAYDALKGKRNLTQPQPLTERLALKPGQPAARAQCAVSQMVTG
jgi:hypothetical protein